MASKPLTGTQDLITKTVTYSTELGRGAFASVYRAKCDELPCAAKILFTIFQNVPGVGTVNERFFQECEYLKNIKHPNVVQYLGLCQEPTTNQPVLLMELMDDSLTHFLDKSKTPLSRHVQLSLCHDVTLALAHLHSLGIVHRDLSSNNVLLIGPGSRAKVSDFGMSKVIDTSKSKYMTPLSVAPGTVVYMPQEALGENPNYTEKLDCFSFGVLAIQVMTRLFPEPEPRTKEVESALSPNGMVRVPVLETECRKYHINMISKTHPLLEIAIECLSLKMAERPPAQDLCRRIEDLKNSGRLSDEIVSTSDVDSCSSAELQEAKQSLLEEVARLKVMKDELVKRVSDLSEQVEQRTMREETPPEAPTPTPGVLSIKSWKRGASAQSVVAKSSTTVIAGTMCCCIDKQVYEYNVMADTWKQLPLLTFKNYLGLSIAFHPNQGKLLAIKNWVISIVHDGQWVDVGKVEYVPWGMLYCDGYFLLLCSNGEVQIIQSTGNSFSERSAVVMSPAFTYASAKICKGTLYIVGVCNREVWSNRAYRVPLDFLLPKNELPKASWFDFSKLSKKRGTWQEIASLPVTRSTCVCFNNRLLAVGGFTSREACGDIFHYDEDEDKWVLVGSIPTPRYNCQAEVVGDKLIVVGGWLNHFSKCDTVEIATLNL